MCAAAALVDAAGARAADEIHWTVTGPTSLSFDWRGNDTAIRYGLTARYDRSVTAAAPAPVPTSSAGPFWEARLTGLLPDTLYHYAIGAGTDHTFRTARRRGTSAFVVMAEGDVGTVSYYPRVGVVQQMVADQRPAFTLMVGDLTYANDHGQAQVDNHFNDVMVWSQDAAYMPAWGNHEWDSSGDDLRNYKGRLDLPNPQTSPGTPAISNYGEDWYWFDYGNVRFIAYPEPWSGAWADWYTKAKTLMDQAQSDPTITFIVTMGHRPAYSSGHHPGDSTLRGYMDDLGKNHSKYKLNVNGHSHDYERTYPQSGVIHITAGIGGSSLEEDPSGSCLWAGGCPAPAYSAFRAFHHGIVRLTFGLRAIQIDALCGPAGDGGTNLNDISCTQGGVFDHVTIRSDIAASRGPDGPPAAFSAALAPNPVLGGGTITFAMPRAGRASASIQDLAGRRVRTVVEGKLAAGIHQYAFDGRSDTGARLPAGVYFYSVSTPSGMITRRFTMLR